MSWPTVIELDATVRAELVTIPRLREVFPAVRGGMLTVIASNNEPWSPEDVYSELVNGRAMLYVFKEGEKIIGFEVLQITQFPFEYENLLNIWIGWADGGGLGHYGLEAAREISRRLGLKRVVFSTTQRSSWIDSRFRRLNTWYEVR